MQCCCFSSHYAFLEDCFEAHVLGVSMTHFGMDDLDSRSTMNKPPAVLKQLPVHIQLAWLKQQATTILELVCPSLENGGFPQLVCSLKRSLTSLKCIEDALRSCFTDGWYECTDCAAKYKMMNALRRHMESKHNNTFSSFMYRRASVDKIYKSDSLVQMLFLIYNLWDAYRLCDGDRIFISFKLVLLYIFTSTHTKYRLWIWRALAFEMALLTPMQSFEYRWNCSANINGGCMANIADDNLVEVIVRLLKESLKQQGSKLSFQSDRTASLTLLYTDKIKENLMKECKTREKKQWLHFSF